MNSNLLLEQLQLYNFKNYEALKLTFRSQLICFTGRNGSGKTNILDAIYYLSTTKSFINAVDTLSIRQECEQASITGEYVRDASQEQIILALRKGAKKLLKRNFKEYDRLSEHIGLLPVVVISPYDIVLIWEGSEERRKFLDVCISQHDAKYLHHLMSYNHALVQRNNVLKSMKASGQFHADFLEPWDFQLIEHGAMIHSKRQLFVQQFQEDFKRVYHLISDGVEEPELKYESELHQASISDLLRRNMDKDRLLERTTTGVHRDDLAFTINQLSIKKMASQGQQKSYLIAMKLAQYLYMSKHQKIAPILLLDDLFDKIDEQRARKILEWVKVSANGQVFMTDTHDERIPGMLDGLEMKHQHIVIKGGEAAEMNKE
jgi:DNA replication and repair protein RecF